MKIFVYVSIFLSSIFISAQSNFTEADARGVIDTFFEGFHQGDTVKMRSVMVKDLPTQTVFTNKEGEHMVNDSNGEDFIKAIGNRPAEQKWEERLLDYKVQIDGNLAHVWTPYEFWLNGSFRHCGANAFTLAKTNDGWKIVHLIDSRRRSSCKTE
ncbi:nuclear transport factor 2 family protein [Aureitalea sp. L0-47]|uniref:nuclear transport factor 2 family protein n=1 Tax=Aureitalea sp. L0-47 TaxID=2816962 RepID=UPI002237A91D|nr:nuclear transport factor 2 family protein [Aureitalea sp. L0-47]MCW5520572.1 nuclear transport factor 2 family protein [Aureitalea sp. L0-47]